MIASPWLRSKWPPSSESEALRAFGLDLPYLVPRHEERSRPPGEGIT